MSSKVVLSGVLAAVFGVLAASCPNEFIKSWYDDEDAGPALAGAAGTCDILLFHFTEPAAIGVAGGGSGDAGDRALISITYPAGTGIPGDDKIKIFHDGAAVEAEGGWDAGVRDYTVTAASGARKYYRVTATESAQPPLPDTCDLILYYFTNPGTGELLGVGKIGAEGGGGASGGVADPVPVSIGYPEGTSFPLAEDDTHLYHNGAVAVALGDWSYSGGSFVRLYRVTAASGAAEKYYRVTATKESPAPAAPSDTRDILLYYFTDPASVGIPDPGNPLEIKITYPAGTGIPADEDAIKIVHNGKAVTAGGWNGGVRAYTVEAENGLTRTYQVTAEMAAGPPGEACNMLLYYFRAPGTVPPVLLSDGSNGKLILEGKSGTEKDPFFIEITYPAETNVPEDEDIIYLASGAVTPGAWENDGETRVRLYMVTAASGAKKYYQVRASREASAVIAVTGVSLSPEILILVPGGSATLTAEVKPDNATNKAVLWSSSNTEVATVKDGVVSAEKVGNAAIIATTADGGYTAVCAVTVSIPVKGISVTPGSLTIAVGESAVLKAAVTPPEADQTVTWVSENPTIATVDGKTGLITGKAEGETKITATSSAGPSFTPECLVTVTPKVTGVIIRLGGDPIETLPLAPGGEETLNALVTQDGASQAVTWTSSDDTIVKPDDDNPGKLKAGTTLGTAVITATTVVGGYKATCIVTVGVRVNGITLNRTSLVLDSKNAAGETLTATVLPSNVTNRTLNWTSSDTSVAPVSPDTGQTDPITGTATVTVTPNAPGTAVITVTTADGGYTATCIVTVVVKVTGITLDSGSIIRAPGEYADLTATVTPSNATNQTLYWTSSKPLFAEFADGSKSTSTGLNGNGEATMRVTAKSGAAAVGTTTITVSTADGGYTATCTVIVRIQVTSVSIPASLTLFVEDSKALTPTITPSNATITEVTWETVPTNSSVAKVDGTGWISGSKNGWVTGKAAGTATIMVTVKTVDSDLVPLLVQASCIVTVKPLLSSDCAILAYDFTDPDSVGNIDESSGYGTKLSPYEFSIIPSGATLANWQDLLTPVVDDEHIQIAWIGNTPKQIVDDKNTSADTPTSGWDQAMNGTDKGPFTRLYVVTAENSNIKKYYRVVAQPDLDDIPDLDTWNATVAYVNALPDGTAEQIWNITGNFDVPGLGTSTSTITGTNKKVRLTTTKSHPHTITLGGTGSLIRTAPSQTFIIDGDIILQGKANDTALVYIAGGTVELRNGTINGNIAATGSDGGGVQVGSGGTFKITGGTVSGNKATASGGSGGGVQVANGGKFTMSAGTITGNTSASDGGGVQVESGGEFTMSGGTVTANTVTAASGTGGGVWTAGTTTMSGGNVTANTFTAASGTGGGVYVAGGSFTLSGGTVAGHTATDGGGVYVAGGSFTLSGNAVISKNEAANGGGVYVNNSSGTTKMSVGTIAENTATDNGGGVYIESGTFEMSGGTVGGTATTGSGNTATASGGGVYVASGGTFTMSSSGTVGGVSTSGYGNEATVSGGGVYVASGGTFTMSGSSAYICGNKANGSDDDGGGGVYVGSTGNFTMSNGTIGGVSGSGYGNEAAKGGGVYDASAGTSTMSGGTIAGNKATDSGGGVYIEIGTFSMSGGTIGGASTSGLGNEAATSGGGVYVATNGTFKMTQPSGKTTAIRGNKAVNGGGVYNTGTFEMTNGTIGGATAGYLNTATSSGGGVYNSDTFDMKGGTISKNVAKSNTASTYGGGVYNSKTFTMSVGTISGNEASVAGTNVGYGGGVYAASTGTFEMKSGTIGSENKATLGGGVHTAGAFTMDTGTISGNSAKNSGGGVSVDSTGSFTMSGGTIGGTTASAGNTADQSGGGVYIENGTFTKTGASGIIRNNSANKGLAGSGLAVILLKDEDLYYCDGTLNGTNNISTEDLSTNWIKQ
jgi:uncharacterized protein YjdB